MKVKLFAISFIFNDNYKSCMRQIHSYMQLEVNPPPLQPPRQHPPITVAASKLVLKTIGLVKLLIPIECEM